MKRFLAALTLIFLSACSPHPGAGGWRATSGDAAFERLEVRYDGRADFYTNTGDSESAWRCFWSGADKWVVGLKCINANDAGMEREFRLVVDESGQAAVLIQGDSELGHYAWQPPTDS